MAFMGLAVVLWIILLLARIGKRAITWADIGLPTPRGIGADITRGGAWVGARAATESAQEMGVSELPVAYSELRSLAGRQGEQPLERAMDLVMGAIADLVARDDVILARRTYPVTTQGLLTRPTSSEVSQPILTRRRLYVGSGVLEQKIAQVLRTDQPMSVGELVQALAGPDARQRAQRVLTWVDQALSQSPPNLDALASPDDALAELERFREAMRRATRNSMRCSRPRCDVLSGPWPSGWSLPRGWIWLDPRRLLTVGRPRLSAGLLPGVGDRSKTCHLVSGLDGPASRPRSARPGRCPEVVNREETLMSEEHIQTPADEPAPPPEKGEAAKPDVAKELQELGRQLTAATKAVLDSPEARELGTQLQHGLEALEKTVGQLVGQARETKIGQRVESSVGEAATTVKERGVLDTLVESVAGALHTVNQTLGQAVEKAQSRAEEAKTKRSTPQQIEIVTSEPESSGTPEGGQE